MATTNITEGSHWQAPEYPKKASGGQDLLIFGDEVINAQVPGPEPNWQESVVLTWFDEGNQIGGFHRLGQEPNLPGGGMISLWNQIFAPPGIFKTTRYIPLRPQDRPKNGALGSGDDTCWHIYENGVHQWTFKDQDISAVVKFRDTGPNLSGFPQSKTMTTEFASHHFDIPGRVNGTLTMKGHTYTINGLGIRDKAWGPRDWNKSIMSHRWVVGTCGEELSFIGVHYHSHDDRIARFGWVVRHGVVTIAKSVDIVAYIEADGCVNRGGSVKYVLDDGEELTFQHTPVATASVAFDHGIVCVDRHCTWTSSTGLKGFSTFETSNNIQGGTRRPGLLVDGILESGFWPKN